MRLHTILWNTVQLNYLCFFYKVDIKNFSSITKYAAVFTLLVKINGQITPPSATVHHTCNLSEYSIVCEWCVDYCQCSIGYFVYWHYHLDESKLRLRTQDQTGLFLFCVSCLTSSHKMCGSQKSQSVSIVEWEPLYMCERRYCTLLLRVDTLINTAACFWPELVGIVSNLKPYHTIDWT